MIREYKTIEDCTRLWVSQFNAIDQGMIAKLMELDPGDWHEVTAPAQGDRVYCYLPVSEHSGEIDDIFDDGEGNLKYRLHLDDDSFVDCESDDFDVEYDGGLPMWGTMWSFGDSADDWWLSDRDGIRLMSECGFRIFESEEFGYFFGIDAAGCNFYEAFWCPLYKARGLHWHDDAAEHEYQMRRKGYEQKMYCGKLWWCNGDDPIEEVHQSA